jgi:hypothetical protein
MACTAGRLAAVEGLSCSAAQSFHDKAMREASIKFRRIAGHQDMPRLVRALRAHEMVERQESVA